MAELQGPAYLAPPPHRGAREEGQSEPKPDGILAFDIATTTGWAYLYPGARPLWGHQRFGSVGASSGEVMHRAMIWADALFIRFRPKYVVYESPYVPRPATSKIRPAGAPPRKGPPPLDIAVVRRLCALCYLFEMVAFERSTEIREVDTSTWCKFFTGTARWGGRAEKKAATIRTCGRYGWTPVTDDEADALGIAAYAESVYAPRLAHRRSINAGGELALSPEEPHRDRIGRRKPS